MGKFKHGYSGTSEYRSWLKMRERCYYKKHPFYYKYGGNGITVSKRWLGVNGFTNFITDMGEKPTSNHTIDRIDNTKGYFPNNCRWANRVQQATNTSQAILYDGISIAGWARKLGVSNTTFHRWVKRIGFEEAIHKFSLFV